VVFVQMLHVRRIQVALGRHRGLRLRAGMPAENRCARVQVPGAP
jgi:hypothetical protein